MDRYDTSSVLPLLDTLNPISKGLYLTTIDKITYGWRSVSPRYSHGSFASNAPLISLSCWDRARKLVLCGEKGQQGYTCYCNMPRWCSECARRIQARLYCKFSKSFGRASYWYAITYSFTSNLFLHETNKETYLARWHQANSFILALKAEGLINGAFAAHELSIASISGQAVFPHTHIVCNSDWDTLVDTNGVLHETIAAEASRAGVSIKVQPLLSSLSLINELKYPVKAINLQNIYESEATNLPVDQINTAFDSLISTLTTYEHGFSKLRYYGNMAACCKSRYIGERLNKGSNGSLKKSTKSLKSTAITPTIKPVQYTDAVAMTPITSPYAPQSPQGTPPAQPRRRFSIGRLLGTGAAGAGILGGLDMAFNKGRLMQGGLTSLKNFINNKPSVTALPTPTTVGDRVADMSAGYTGTAAGHVTPSQFQDLTGGTPQESLWPMHRDASAYSEWKNPIMLKGNNSVESMTPAAAQGWYQDYMSRNPGAFKAPRIFNPFSGSFMTPEGADLAPKDETIAKLMESDIASGASRTGMNLGDVQKWAPSSVGDRVVDTVAKTDLGVGAGTLGAGAVGAIAPKSSIGARILAARSSLPPSLLRGLGRASAGVGVGLGARSMAQNPLVREIDQTAADAQGGRLAQLRADVQPDLATGVTGALGAAVPVASIPLTVGGFAGGALLDNKVDNLRRAGANYGEGGAAMDVLSRLDRGAVTNPHYRQAIRKILTQMEQDPATLTKMRRNPVADMLINRVQRYR